MLGLLLVRSHPEWRRAALLEDLPHPDRSRHQPSVIQLAVAAQPQPCALHLAQLGSLQHDAQLHVRLSFVVIIAVLDRQVNTRG